MTRYKAVQADSDTINFAIDYSVPDAFEQLMRSWDGARWLFAMIEASKVSPYIRRLKVKQ